MDAAYIGLTVFSKHGEWIFLEDIPIEKGTPPSGMLTDLMKDHPFFICQFEKIFCNLTTPAFTMVPKEIGTGIENDLFLRFNHSLNNDEIAVTDESPQAPAVCCFKIEKKIKNMLESAFPNIAIRHSMSHLPQVLPFLQMADKRTCLLNFHGGAIDIFLFDGKLIFANCFESVGHEDILYFLLATLYQCKFDFQETTIVMSGDCDAESPLHLTLKSYLPNLKFWVRSKHILAKEEFLKLPAHSYLTLENIFLCAS